MDVAFGDMGGLGSAGECLDLPVLEGFSNRNNSGILGIKKEFKRKKFFYAKQ